jgi:DNA-binding response OmpR family regulator
MKTILIVDDERDITDVVAATLQDEGYRVLTAHNGVDGLSCLSRSTPDMVISDFMMPFMDGATMCQRIHNDPQFKDIPFVIVSVMDERVIGRDFGTYDGYIRKPFRMGVLLKLVRTLLAREARHPRS